MLVSCVCLSDTRRAAGKLFQTVGPLTAKLRCSVFVRALGTIRTPTVADRRRSRPDTVAIGTQNPTNTPELHRAELSTPVPPSWRRFVDEPATNADVRGLA